MDVYYIRNMWSKKCNKITLNNLHQAGPNKPIVERRCEDAGYIDARHWEVKRFTTFAKKWYCRISEKWHGWKFINAQCYWKEVRRARKEISYLVDAEKREYWTIFMNRSLNCVRSVMKFWLLTVIFEWVYWGKEWTALQHPTFSSTGNGSAWGRIPAGLRWVEGERRWNNDVDGPECDGVCSVNSLTKRVGNDVVQWWSVAG